MFRGYNPHLALLTDNDRVEQLAQLWKVIGKQLCEGDDEKYELLEQYLAHLIQFPNEKRQTYHSHLVQIAALQLVVLNGIQKTKKKFKKQFSTTLLCKKETFTPKLQFTLDKVDHMRYVSLIVGVIRLAFCLPVVIAGNCIDGLIDDGHSPFTLTA